MKITVTTSRGNKTKIKLQLKDKRLIVYILYLVRKSTKLRFSSLTEKYLHLEYLEKDLEKSQIVIKTIIKSYEDLIYLTNNLEFSEKEGLLT